MPPVPRSGRSKATPSGRQRRTPEEVAAAFKVDLLLVLRVRRDTPGEKRFLDAKHPELHPEVFELPGLIGQAREAVSSAPAHD